MTGFIAGIQSLSEAERVMMQKAALKRKEKEKKCDRVIAGYKAVQKDQYYIRIIGTMLLTSSCAMLFNKRDVAVSFKPYPEGAKVFIDGDVIGKTPILTRIKPSKNYSILYTKNGYANREFNISHTVADSRLRPTNEHVRCILDWFGFVFILPAISAGSYKCSNFDEAVYFKALDEGNRINIINQNAD